MTLHLDIHSQNLISSIYGIEVINALNATLEKANITANLNFTTVGDYALAHVSTTHNVVLSELSDVREVVLAFKAIDLKPKLAVWLQCHLQTAENKEIIECLYKAWKNDNNVTFGKAMIQKELKILELL